MKHWKQLGAISLSLLLILSTLVGCQSNSSTDPSSPPSAIQPMDLGSVTDPFLATAGIPGSTVVATVADMDILAEQVLYWLAAYMDQYAQRSLMFGIQPQWDSKGDTGDPLTQTLLDNALQLSALFTLLPQKASAEGISLTPEEQTEIDSAFDQMLQDVANGDLELMTQILWSNPSTRELLDTLMSNNFLHLHLQEALFGPDSPNRPTSEQLLAYAQDELQQYRAKHILLKTVDTSAPIESDAPTVEYTPLPPEKVEQQYALAQELLAQLQGATDVEPLFDQLILQYSEDEGSASNPDGYLATVGQMVPPFEEAALALEPGQISGIVESSYGYHIILRLPLNPEDYRAEYVAQQMTNLQDQWLMDNPTQTNSEFEKIDPISFYDKLQSLRLAVDQEVQARTPLPESDISSSAPPAG